MHDGVGKWDDGGKGGVKQCIDEDSFGTYEVGGWLGGMFAMEMFRHKTAKKSFQTKVRSGRPGEMDCAR